MVFSPCRIWTLFTCYLHMYMSSTHYLGICVLCAHLFAVVLDIFLPNRQCQCHPYIISSTLYISYYVQLSFCTLSTHTHIVHLICPCHLHVVCTCTHHLLVISNTPHIPYYPQLSFCTYCLHTHTLSISCVYCLQMHMLCTCHLYCCYLYMYMSSTYYLGIYVLCAHYLKWSLICSFLTDNTKVHPYIISSSLYMFYHGEYVIHTPSR